MIKIFLDWLERRGSHLEYALPNGDPYLDRYYLLKIPRVGGVLLHKTSASDPMPPHSHRWPNFTLVLRGRLWERKYEYLIGELDNFDSRTHGPGALIFRNVKSIHKIELCDEGTPVWTLFFFGRRKQGLCIHTGPGKQVYLPASTGKSELEGWLFPKLSDRGREEALGIEVDYGETSKAATET